MSLVRSKILFGGCVGLLVDSFINVLVGVCGGFCDSCYTRYECYRGTKVLR